VPGLPADLLDHAGEPLGSWLRHGTVQAIFLACRGVNPGLSRDALDSDVTLDQLAYWIARHLTDIDVSDRSNRPPRGSYTTPNVTLRPIFDSDLQALYWASLDPRLAHRWRFRGQTPDPDTFRSMVYSPNVLVQFMVVSESPAGPAIGLVSAYDADTVGGHGKIAMQRLRDVDAPDGSGGLMIEGFLVFIQYLFDHFDFAKLYIEVPEYNRTLLGAGDGNLFREEGELKNHLYYGDRRWSMHILAVYRDDWEAVAQHFRGDWPDALR